MISYSVATLTDFLAIDGQRLPICRKDYLTDKENQDEHLKIYNRQCYKLNIEYNFKLCKFLITLCNFVPIHDTSTLITCGMCEKVS